MPKSLTADYEQYECPQDFKDRLNEVGGFNRYGGENFKVVWGQGGEDACYYRAGGAWHIEGLPSFVGYRDLLIGSGVGAWNLLQWHPPEHYGSPELWYFQNHDPETGLSTLAEFPYMGRYELLYSLRYTEKRGNALHFEYMPLSSFLISTVVPIILAAKDVSYAETKAVLLDQKTKDDTADVDNIESIMQASALPFKGAPVSYSKQGCRTSLVDKKITEMTRHWNKIQTNAKALGRGLSVHDRKPA